MTTTRAPQWFLTLVFLGIIFSPALVQVALELNRRESPQALALFKTKPTAASLHAYEKNLEDANWVAKTLRPWMQFAQFHLLHDAGDKALFGRDGWFFYRPGVEYVTRRARVGLAQDGADPLPAILAFRDDLAARGIRLLLLPMPNKESVYPEKLSTRAGWGATVMCGQTRSLMERARAAGVDVIDMFEAFAEDKRANGSDANPLYLAQDSHWSPAGVRRAARWVAESLVARGWIERGVTDFPVAPVPLSKVGDVVRMLQSTQIERRIRPETFTCEKVLPGSRQPSENSDRAQILVLGDSFLRIFQNDEPGSAGFISHLARELKQPVSSIVSDGGASTLVRQELHRRSQLLSGKKVVIWEFVERDIRFGAEGWQVIRLPKADAL